MKSGIKSISTTTCGIEINSLGIFDNGCQIGFPYMAMRWDLARRKSVCEHPPFLDQFVNHRISI